MKNFTAALWAETLKMRRSKVPFFIWMGFSVAPLIAGLFMIIMKDPDAAKSMGLIGSKAQIMTGTADWATFFSVITQAVAVAGAILFAILTGWVFGREYSDRTAKELLALPVSRATIISAKFVVLGVASLGISVWVFLLGWLVGNLVDIPGYSTVLLGTAFVDTLGTALLTIALIPFVAFVSSFGKGYMPAFGWAVFTVAIAQIAAITGWGDWLPWSAPALFSGAAGPRAEMLGAHSYIIVLLSSVVGLGITFYWWMFSDQAK
ncbi:MAG: ABC transporter permease [Anaerolineales bacterium]